MRINHTKLIHGALFFAMVFLTACGGGGGGAAPATTTFTIGGTVTGLTGSGLVLQSNGSDNLSISADGSFVFATPQASGTYQLTVQTQPSGQFCSVNPTSVTVSAANITTVAVTCAASSNTYTIGGTISGLTGTGLVLLNNSGNNLTVGAGATAFTFSTALASGATYTVTVGTQPSGQTCTVSTPTNTGTVSAANITTVAVTCATATNAYTIGGNVTGLTGTGLVLHEVGGDNLAISTNGTFVFATPHANSYVYYVTVLTQPAGQTCAVASGVGVVSGANVTVVSVTCATATYTIGGNISGLGSSTGLQLQNNGGDTLNVSTGAGAFTFGAKLPSGTTYNVTIFAQPTTGGKFCTVNSPSGPVTSANIASVSVTCSTASYTVGGTVTNLTGGGLLLQDNGAEELSVTSSPYTFLIPLASGSTYNVTVKTQPTTPAAQVCTVANATGTILANVTNANVTCVNAYTIGGTITGAAPGIGPILQNNLGDNLFIPAITTGATNFTFSTPIADLTAYSVTQLIRARAPSQDCSVITGGSNGNGSGTVSGVNVITVSITCSLSTVVPKFAYVTNSTAYPAFGVADTVSAFTIAAGGDLAAATTPTTASGDGPYAVAVDPTGLFAYVVNSNADSVSAYGITPVSGVLTVIDANGASAGSQPSIPTGDNPVSIAIHPSGKFAYVANQLIGVPGTLSAYSIDMTNGALATIDADAVTPSTQPTIATGTNPYAVTVDPLGKFAYVANNDGGDVSVYTIDQTSGALTAGTSVAAGTNPRSVAIDPTGKCALVASAGSDNIKSYMIGSVTGALTPVSTIATGVAPRSVAIDPNTGLYAYVANAGSSDVSAYGITLASCAIASIDTDAVTGGVQATIAAGSAPFSANVDPSGQFVYVANFGSFDSINRIVTNPGNVSVYGIGVAGALTPVAGSPFAAGNNPTSVTTTQ